MMQTTMNCKPFFVCLALLVVVGCSHEPAISKANVKAVDKLRAAIAAKKSDWLDRSAKQIEGIHEQGKLSEDEYAALSPIIADARKGHWDDAHDKLTRLITAQQR